MSNRSSLVYFMVSLLFTAGPSVYRDVFSGVNPLYIMCPKCTPSVSILSLPLHFDAKTMYKSNKYNFDRMIIMQVKSLIVKYPRITSYQIIASLTTILESYESSTCNWLYSKYIQLYSQRYNIDDSNFFLIRGNFYDGWDINSCPFIKQMRWERNQISKKWDSIVDFIIDQINDDYYALILLDGFYIPHSIAYNKNHKSPHDTFIYGYDKNNKEFLVADFYHKHQYKYSFEKVSFQQIELAYKNYYLENADPEWEMVKLYKYSDQSIDLDVDEICNSIVDYILSKNTTYKSNKIINYNPNVPVNYGLKYYDDFVSYLENGSYQIQSAYVLKDHKNFMIDRLKYLGEIGRLKDSKSLVQEYTHIAQRISTLLSMLIKYQIKNDPKIMSRIISGYLEVADDEYVVLSKVANNLIT